MSRGWVRSKVLFVKSSLLCSKGTHLNLSRNEALCKYCFSWCPLSTPRAAAYHKFCTIKMQELTGWWTQSKAWALCGSDTVYSISRQYLCLLLYWDNSDKRKNLFLGQHLSCDSKCTKTFWKKSLSPQRFQIWTDRMDKSWENRFNISLPKKLRDTEIKWFVQSLWKQILSHGSTWPSC